MSLLSHLNNTFEKLSSTHSDLVTDASPLCPCNHVIQNVELCVTLSNDGRFKDAAYFMESPSETSKGKAPKAKAKKIPIPVTNESASRTSGPSPHPLVDCFQYLAPDFPEYSIKGKGDFEAYRELLQSWCESPYAHPKVQSVLQYISKGTLISDLLGKGLLEINPENGKLKTEKLFVAWRVLGVAGSNQSDFEGPDKQELWRNTEVFNSWINFYGSQQSLEGLCIISGQVMPLADKHPKKILLSDANAKLISANDMSGFTFRGRFTDSKESIKKAGLQAANIGEKITQQAHSALGWLLQNRGRQDAGQAVVAWSTSGEEVRQPEAKLEDQLAQLDLALSQGLSDSLPESGGEAQSIAPLSSERIGYDHTSKLGKFFSEKLHKKLAGYRSRLDYDDRISVLTLESAVPGRLAATYYVESMPQTYYDAIELWYEQFSYPRSFDVAKKSFYIRSPVPDEIFKCAYGEKNDTDGLKRRIRADIIAAIVEGGSRNIQFKLVQNSFQRACRPLGQDRDKWSRNLWIACCLYRGFNLRQNLNKRSFNMALDTSYQGRDYLFGRLLAVADSIEGYSLSLNNELRPTTAQRYMQQFANRPAKTWQTIRNALTPHLNRLKTRKPGFYMNRTNLLDEVMGLFENIADYSADKALSPEFLLGYHSQRLELMARSQGSSDLEETAS